MSAPVTKMSREAGSMLGLSDEPSETIFFACSKCDRKAAFHTTSSFCLRAQNSYGRPHKNKRSYVHAQASW